MTVTATIPCVPYLAAFLRWKERLQPDEALDLGNTSGDLGYILAGMLTTKVKARSDDKKRLSESKYTEDLQFIINPRRFNHGQIIITEANVRYFNNYLHKNLHEVLLDRILQGVGKGEKEVDIIYGFIAEIGAIDLVSFETLKKSSYRLRNSKKIDPFRSHQRKTA